MNHKDSVILIVDDTPENIDILSDVLKDYERKIAVNGERALNIANSETPPDIILLDIMMPGMDGFEVCKRLKSEDRTKDIPVIFITARDDQESLIKGFDSGAVDYIKKPINSDEVLRRVNLHLSLIKYRKELENLNKNLEGEVKNRTHELIIARDKAEESNRLKSHFLSLMSHELRTPMMGILGFSEILKEELKEKELSEYADNLFNASTRLKDTLEAILNMSRIESSKQNMEISEFDIVEKIKELLKTHTSKANLKGLALNFKPDSESTIAYLDSVKFEIIFNNIVDNAIKYTRQGDVSVNLTVTNENKVRYHKITVKDTGIGIPEEMHDVIFDEFRQADEGMGRNFEGVGLGLSLVRKYIHAMNGEISLQSTPGMGTEFTILLPSNLSIRNYVRSKTEDETEEIKLPDKKIRLLLVEDDASNVKIYSIFLNDFCDISVAKNSEEAFILADQYEYDCILMDINLGKGLSGVDITKALRAQEKYKDIPIIACTAYALEGDKENFLEIGCSHYIAKPSRREKLREIIIKSLL